MKSPSVPGTIRARKTLDDGFDASMALADSEIFLRGFRYLYAIAE